MRLYKVRVAKTAIADLNALSKFLLSVLSLHGAQMYKDMMLTEIQSLSIYGDLYRVSRYADVRAVHPRARHMASHNKKWSYIFHIEDDMVVVDRILPSKLIKH